jgi:hypothetical protein
MGGGAHSQADVDISGRQIWSLISLHCVGELFGHTRGVRTIRLLSDSVCAAYGIPVGHGAIATGSYDGTVKVRLQTRLPGSIISFNGPPLQIWDRYTYRCVATLHIDDSFASAVCVLAIVEFDRYLVAACSDHIIRVRTCPMQTRKKLKCVICCRLGMSWRRVSLRF